MRLSIKLPKAKIKLKSVSKNEAEILQILKTHVKDIKKHFEKSGWKLDAKYLEEAILYDILGFHISDVVNQLCINEGLEVEYKNGDKFIQTIEPYCPIYMNVRTGKIYLVNNTDNTDYIFKYKESNGFVEIGKL